MYREHASTCWRGPVSRSRRCWAVEGGDEDSGAVCVQDPPAEVRWDVVARARKAIAAGVYDDPELLERAVGRLLERLEIG